MFVFSGVAKKRINDGQWSNRSGAVNFYNGGANSVFLLRKQIKIDSVKIKKKLGVALGKLKF